VRELVGEPCPDALATDRPLEVVSDQEQEQRDQDEWR
jgi:hypothetical protein